MQQGIMGVVACPLTAFDNMPLLAIATCQEQNRPEEECIETDGHIRGMTFILLARPLPLALQG